MQSAGLRQRAENGHSIQLSDFEDNGLRPGCALNGVDARLTGSNLLGEDANLRGSGFEPPRFTVNLGLHPTERYNHIIPHLQQQLSNADLKDLFDDVIRSVAPAALAKCIHGLARIALRRVYSSEETAELRGISEAAGVSLHLLIAFNVLLDLLLGCTSGGCRVNFDQKSKASGSNHAHPASRLLHFRTLDWGMDALRQIVVEIDYVSSDDGPVVASSLTYFGYVGVLTGVRSNLSMSLNFRPYHDRSTLRKRLSFRKHQLMVLLGLRQSISSGLRQCLLSPDEDDEAQSKTYRNGQVVEDLPPMEGGRRMSHMLRQLACSPSTAAYLIFCTPQKVYVVEKDHCAAFVRSSRDFLTAYNHDLQDEEDRRRVNEAAKDLAGGPVSGMEDLVQYSIDRKSRLDGLWRKAIKGCRKSKPAVNAVGVKDVLHMVGDVEISNDETHYAVIMDPQEGRIIWRKVYPEDDSDVE